MIKFFLKWYDLLKMHIDDDNWSTIQFTRYGIAFEHGYHFANMFPYEFRISEWYYILYSANYKTGQRFMSVQDYESPAIVEIAELERSNAVFKHDTKLYVAGWESTGWYMGSGIIMQLMMSPSYSQDIKVFMSNYDGFRSNVPMPYKLDEYYKNIRDEHESRVTVLGKKCKARPNLVEIIWILSNSGRSDMCIY